MKLADLATGSDWIVWIVFAKTEQEVSVYRYEGSICDHGASDWDHKKYFKQEVLSEERTVDRFI